MQEAKALGKDKAASVAMILAYYGRWVPLDKLREDRDRTPSFHGTALRQNIGVGSGEDLRRGNL